MKARFALSQNVIEPRTPHCGHCRKPVVYAPEIRGGFVVYLWVHAEAPECRALYTRQDIVDQFGGSWWEEVARRFGMAARG